MRLIGMRYMKVYQIKFGNMEFISYLYINRKGEVGDLY
jgi:hypothetical protein